MSQKTIRPCMNHGVHEWKDLWTFSDPRRWFSCVNCGEVVGPDDEMYEKLNASQAVSINRRVDWCSK